MTLFIVAALVALLGSVFNSVLAAAYRTEYDRRLRVAMKKSGSTLGYGLSPDVLGTWFERVADVAANFPAVVLTLLAFVEIEPFSSSALFVSVLLLVAVAFTLVVFVTNGPTRSIWSWRIKRVKNLSISLSIWTLILIGLNLAGVIFVIAIPSIATE